LILLTFELEEAGTSPEDSCLVDGFASLPDASALAPSHPTLHPVAQLLDAFCDAVAQH
jgi:hypothetical protein